MPRAALVLAYAADPHRGSEPGAGWGVAKATARAMPVYLLVRADHAASVALGQSESIDVVPVEDPAQRKRSGRIRHFIAYLRWLPRAQRAAKRTVEERHVELALHATYSTYWLPSPIVSLGVPSVWGPVGGAVTSPRALWFALSIRGVLVEWLDFLAVRLAALLPRTRRTWRKATVRIVQNEETLRRLPSKLQADTYVFNHAFLIDPPNCADRRPESWLLWVSPMETRKGGPLVLHALAQTPPDVHLKMAGDGPDRPRLERIARRLGIEDRVEFLGWVPRDELWMLFSTCAASVFTGLREEGGLSLAETLFSGTPVIVLANGGARTVAERATDPTRVVLVTPKGRSETITAMAAAMTRFSRQPPKGTGPLLDCDALQAEFQQMLMSALTAGE